MVCVKYCVFTFPLVVTAVQTHGGVSSALHSIHAPTRNEAGTYIRASAASDLDTLSTPKTPNHQGMVMNIFLLGGWVARPSASLFLRLRWFLVLFCLAWSLSFSLSPCLFYAKHNRTLSAQLFVVALPVPCSRCFTWSPLFVLLRCQSLLIARCLYLVYSAFPRRSAVYALL